MSIDLDFDASQAALKDAVAQFCRDHDGDEVARSTAESSREAAWRGLVDLGVLAAAAPGEGGGALEALAVVEAVGGSAFPGPVCESLAATQVLPPDECAAVAEGHTRVTLAATGSDLVPWAPGADVFLEADAATGEAWRVRPVGEIEPVATLGGEPWARIEWQRIERLVGGERALALFDVVMAGRLAAAGSGLVFAAAEHALTRIQFGRSIGEFQAVAHPLADAHMALEGAAALARAAACALDQRVEGAAGLATAGRASARRAALEAVHVGHQVFGAVGITLEGPVFRISRQIRQWASHPVGAMGSIGTASRIVDWLAREAR